MESAIIYPVILFFVFYFLGYGISRLLLPKKLQPYSLPISPWVTVIAVIFSMVILGSLGLSTKLIVIILTTTMILSSIYVIVKFGLPKVDLSTKIIFALALVLVLLNLLPMLLQQRFLTTLSLGGNDAKAFAAVPDYLLTHSVRQAFEEQTNFEVHTLFSFGWRVGPSVLMAFFQQLLGLAGYQLLTIIQTVLFAAAMPLIYILFNLLNREKNNFVAIVTAILVGTNVNIIYYLYHNFIGQIIFLGLSLLVTILLISYEKILKKQEKVSLIFNRHDFLISVVLSVIFFSYHEAAVFILIPIGIIALFHIFSKQKSLVWTVAYSKSLFLTFLLAWPAIIHSIRFAIFYRTGDFNAEVGWQAFRQSGSSFISPFEMTGLYSIHSLPSLPIIISIILSLGVIGMILYGAKKSNNNILMSSFVATYGFFILLLSLVRPNFWFYDRAVSYGAPILITLLMIGLVSLLQSKKHLIPYILVVIVWISFINNGLLMKRYWRENLAVDRWMTILSDMPKLTEDSIIYSEQIFNPDLPIWKELWAEYFLGDKVNFITSLEYAQSNNKIKDDDLVLISKVVKYIIPSNLLFNKVVWENNYYKLGSLCISDKCLLNNVEDLSQIDFAESQYVDSLLVDGWGVNEGDHRWIVDKLASVRLINKHITRSLIIEAITFQTPQAMTVKVDNQKMATIKLTENWQEFRIPIKVLPGIHSITFEFSSSYKPSEYGQGFDNRALSANVRKMRLE